MNMNLFQRSEDVKIVSIKKAMLSKIQMCYASMESQMIFAVILSERKNSVWNVFVITMHLLTLARVRFSRATKKSVRIAEI